LRLRSDYFHEPWAETAREKAHAKNNDPGRRAKLSAAMRGRPMLPHVRAALLASHVGKKASAETRRKQSEAQKSRGWHPTGRTWTEDEDKWLGQDTDRAIAARLGRTWSSVCSRRERLGIASWRLKRKQWKRLAAHSKHRRPRFTTRGGGAVVSSG
jgi:hypothetical protein